MARLLRSLLHGLAWLAIFLAVLAAGLRLATPLLNDYRDELADLVGEQLGTPVHIGEIRAHWVGWGPRLSVYGLSLGSGPQRTTARRADFSLEMNGLLSGRLHLRDAMRLTVDGLHMHLVREAGGQMHLKGIGILGGDIDPQTPAPVFPNHLLLSDTKLIFEDLRAHKPAIDVGRIDIDLRRDGQRLRLRGALQGATGQAEIAADLNGFLSRTDWEGDTYLRVDDLDVARLLALYLPAEYRLDSLGLDLEVWSTWRNAVAVDNVGHIELRDLDFAATTPSGEALLVPHISTDYRFRRTGRDLELVLDGLRLRHGGRAWPTGRAALQISGPAERRMLRAAADFVRIEDVLAVLRVRFPWAGLQDAAMVMQPVGDLRDLRLEVVSGATGYDWRGALQFDDLALKGYSEAPGFSGLSGTASGRPGHLAVRLDARDAVVDMGDMFLQPLEFGRIAGDIDVLFQAGDDWTLRTHALQADTPHLETLSRMQLVQRVGQPLEVDMQTDFRNGKGEHAARYYPRTVMRPDLVAWLEKTVHTARVPQGRFLLAGPLQDFPYQRRRTGVFEVAFDIADAELDYQRGWPVLHDVAAGIRFHQNSLDMRLDSGNVHGYRIQSGSGHIASLDPLSRLEMQGSASGPLAEAVAMLDEGALKHHFGHVAQALDARGQAQITLDFAVPLEPGGEYRLDGTLRFEDATLGLSDWGLEISRINGELGFDLNALNAVALQGYAMGSDILVDILPLSGGTTRVISYGTFTTRALAEQLPWIPLDLAQGQSEFVIKVDIPPRALLEVQPTLLTIESDLAGVEIALPAPFDKPFGVAERLTVEVPVTGANHPVTVTYGDKAAGVFTSDGQRGALQLGDGLPELRANRVITLRGHVPELDIARWQALAGNYANPDAVNRLPPLEADLTVSRLRYDQLALDNVSLKLRQAGKALRGSLYSEQVTGEFAWPQDTANDPLRIDLERLQLNLEPGEVTAAPGKEPPDLPDPARGPDPRRLPSLAVTCDYLQLNQAKLGNLELLTRRTADGQAIDKFSLAGGEATLDSSGDWTVDAGAYRSSLSGTLASADLGALLLHLGYNRQLEKSGGRITFDLDWPGHPGQARAGNIRARAGLDISEGRFVDVDPGVSRVVGLLNFNALTRRLRLDFSDLFGDGLSFDRIEGKFDIHGGDAYTQDLLMEGPSGTILVTGRTGLVARDFDQIVTVTPQLDATLPLASTLTGGPLAGLAVLVVQEILSGEVDKINRFEYRVQGPWQAPRIEQLESGGALSRLMGGGATDRDPDDPASGDLPSASNTPGL